MSSTTPIVASSGTFDLGGETPVRRLGSGAMRLPGPGIWGPRSSSTTISSRA